MTTLNKIFLSLNDKVIFQKWHTGITLVINKEFSLTEIALINSGADMNLNALKCVKTQELFRPSKKKLRLDRFYSNFY